MTVGRTTGKRDCQIAFLSSLLFRNLCLLRLKDVCGLDSRLKGNKHPYLYNGTIQSEHFGGRVPESLANWQMMK